MTATTRLGQIGTLNKGLFIKYVGYEGMRGDRCSDQDFLLHAITVRHKCNAISGVTHLCGGHRGWYVKNSK